MAEGYYHQPVLLREVLECLDPQPGQTFADGTLGGGGHAEAVLRRIGDSGRLYGIDRDQAAIEAAGERLSAFPGFCALRGNFHDVDALLPEGVLLDGGLLVFVLVRSLIRDKKAGKSACGGNCAGCGSCASCAMGTSCCKDQ